ncbi:MAG: TolC family protein [Nitrosomonas sp.]|nr:TolC family protein [Nitrosomonas sp.]
MNIYGFFLVLGLSTLTAHAETQIRRLTEFQSHVDQAASVLKTKADLEAQQYHLQANEAQKGWEVFGTVSGGYQKSPFAREPFGRFFDPLARIGLRYPLLGSAERQDRAISDAATQVQIETIRHDWSKRLAALVMEENYAAYWSAQKMLALTETYLDLRNLGVEKVLQQRNQTGLLLMSDYFEFMSAFERAERAQLEFINNRDQALTRLMHLTNLPIAPFDAVKPGLSNVARETQPDIQQPDLMILQAQTDHLRKIRETEHWQGIDSDLSLVAFGGPAIPHPSPESSQFGYGGAVGFNFRMPLEIVSYRRNEQSRLGSQLVSLQTEFSRRGQELDLEFKSMLGRYHQLVQQIRFQHTRLGAAKESVRERYLRLHALDGDVIEKYLQAINTYYRTALEYVEAESEQWKLHIRLRQFLSTVSNGVDPVNPQAEQSSIITPLDKARQYFEQRTGASAHPHEQPPGQPEADAANYSVYLWNFGEIQARANFWKKAKKLRIKRILLSLTARQINAAVAKPAHLRNFLQNARRNGISVELLLGDPYWILPEERPHLLAIIKKLKHIHFDGLHLDIEPEQLSDVQIDKKTLEEFVETIRRATAASPWPVAVSVHHRYLAQESSLGICVLCQFAKIGVKEVTVMYYSVNVANVVTTMQSAMQQFPGLSFSLAQSLEPELEPENSYAHKPQAAFRRAMQQLQNQLQAPNFNGLAIQSWKDWEAYIDENPF